MVGYFLRDTVYVDFNTDTRIDLELAFDKKKFPKEFGITHLDKELIELLERKWVLFKIIKGSILH